MAIEVEAVGIGEREAWAGLYRAYADFYHMEMTPTILETVWGWIHDDKCDFWCIVARDDAGECCGLMHYRAMPSPLRGATVGFLDDLFVVPAYRGRGTAQALFTALEQRAREQGWPLVRWITAEDNYRGRAVYDRLAQRTQWVTYQLDINP